MRVRLKGDGREFPLVTAMDMTIGEVIRLEGIVGSPMESWSATQETAAMLWWSMFTAFGQDAWTLDQIGGLRPADVEKFLDPQDEAADPLEDIAGAGPGPSAPSGGEPAGTG